MEIGAQLYTVRDYAKTTEDFAETLKKIADIGYRIVQVSGTCGYDRNGWLNSSKRRIKMRTDSLQFWIKLKKSRSKP